MIKNRLLILVITVLCYGCDSQKGYADLDKLYEDFVYYLKDANLENLKNYCYAITPDQTTVEYMKKNNFSFRGIPEGLEKNNVKPTYIGEKYYEYVLKFRERLKSRKLLNNLKYVKREQNEEVLFNKELEIYATETFIILESEGKEVRCKLGEMLRINMIWKSFTAPNLN
ncbi:MAG: hypothetical protein AAF617_01475 [Bacteroidota bacterium]